MSLFHRKAQQDSIDFWKDVPELPSLEHIESRILDAALFEDSALGYSGAYGSLQVLCGALIEKVRRTDPAYGLIVVMVEDGGNRDNDAS